jgi:hypothetical protein
MTTIEQQVSRIESNERAIQKSAQRVSDIQADQQQRQSNIAAAKETLVVSLARDAGLLDLSPRQIVDALSGLKKMCAAQPAVGSPDASTAKKATKRAKAPHPAAGEARDGSRGSQPASDTGAVHVVVKISRNAAAEKKRVLEDDGMRWSGKAGHWHGQVSEATAERLRKTFAERVTVQSAVTKPPSRGHGSAVADRDDVAIGVGITATAGEPIQAPTEPARPAVASGTAAPPLTPPVDPVAARADGADRATGGTAAAEAAPVVSAPVQELPVSASMAAATPRPAASPFANFRRVTAPR